MTGERRIEGLNGLRAVAVIAVLLAHFGWYVAPGGYLGVDVFFTLSGYLITRLIVGEHNRTGRIALGRFYARRALRLYPALIIAVVLCLALYRQVYADLGQWAREAGLSLTYLMDITRSAGHPSITSAGPLGVTWSLAVEEHFYILWPVAVAFLLPRLGRRRTGLVSAALAAGSWAALVLLSLIGVSGESLYFQPELRSAGLFVGCAVALLARPWSGRALAWAATASLAVLAALFQVRVPNVGLTAYGLTMPVTWLCTSVLLIAAAGGTAGMAGWLLRSPPVAYIGQISYGIYLYHLAFISLFAAEGLRFSERAALSVMVPVGFAALSFEVVERRFLDIKDRRFGSRGPTPRDGRPAGAELSSTEVSA